MDRTVEVRNILRDILEKKKDQIPFSDDDSLLISGRLESIDVLDAVLALEDRFGVDFSVRSFDQNDFDSVNSILRLLEETLQ